MIKPYFYPAKIVNVVDGDTIDVDLDLGFYLNLKNLRLRIKNYNSPECKGDEAIYGKMAKEYLTNILNSDNIHIYVNTVSKDSFGRWLSDVYIQTETEVVALSEKLIEEGWGVFWNGKGTRPTIKPTKYPMK